MAEIDYEPKIRSLVSEMVHAEETGQFAIYLRNVEVFLLTMHSPDQFKKSALPLLNAYEKAKESQPLTSEEKETLAYLLMRLSNREQ